MRQINTTKVFITLVFVVPILIGSNWCGAQVSEPRPFARASAQGAVGEVSNLFLIPPGVYIHPIYNDVTGNTDKLLTASLKLGLLTLSGDTGLEIIAYWRLLTPAVKPAFQRDDLPEPVGRYADWSELRAAYAKGLSLPAGRLRVQGDLGYNDIRNKGGREFHRWVHRVTRNTLDNLEYVDQPEGRFLSKAFNLGWISPPTKIGMVNLTHKIAVNFAHSKMLVETALEHNTVWIVRPAWWEIASELRWVRQHSSEAYHLKPYRYEGAIGVRILRSWTPSLKYVSAYLEGDDIGQTYFDFLHYNHAF